MEVGIRFESADTFQDPDPSALDPSQLHFMRGNEDGGAPTQLAALASAQMSTQFRNFCFSVVLIHQHARLIRWDHSGAIVTRLFDYTACSYLTEFFWRFDCSSREARGHDTTVQEVGGVEAEEGRSRLRCSGRIFSVRVPSFGKNNLPLSSSSERMFYLRAPEFTPHYLAGRWTRGQVVYDALSGETLYMRDSWLITRGEVEKESDVHAAGVPPIAKHEYDVGKDSDIGVATVSQSKCGAPWACLSTKMNALRHHRVLIHEFGREISSFNSSRELVSAIWDALAGV